MILDKIVDLLMFREGYDDDSSSRNPKITTGSIVWGVLLRTAILLVVITLLLESLTMRQYWWFMLFAIWFFAAYPGWLQYRKFNERMEKFQEDTLCGSCLHFDSTSQLCKVYDEHVSTKYIPCEGDSWEPKHIDSDN